MSGRRRGPRDHRRRRLGQNFLVDPEALNRFLDAAQVLPGEVVLDIGAGSGALAVPLARVGADVWAIERDPVWAERLRARRAAETLEDRLRVIEADFRDVDPPDGPYRVVASPPFGLTTQLLAWLLDDPASGPERADLVLQQEVSMKRAAQPPTTLRSAAWSPWWDFELGLRLDRRCFRPMPHVDAAVLVIRKRRRPVLPAWMAPDFREALRPLWRPPS